MKGEREVLFDRDHAHVILMNEYLKESINTFDIYESTQETDYDYWISEDNVNSCSSLNNNL
jgi:hypothetical protein